MSVSEKKYILPAIEVSTKKTSSEILNTNENLKIVAMEMITQMWVMMDFLMETSGFNEAELKAEIFKNQQRRNKIAKEVMAAVEPNN